MWEDRESRVSSLITLSRSTTLCSFTGGSNFFVLALVTLLMGNSKFKIRDKANVDID